jgi:exodeoxyribonuclease VII large subunit
MNLARQALETVRLRVVGEVSEFNDKPGYKAAYFTICDSGASMPCLMWRDAYTASGIALRSGMLVELSGQFSAYIAKGRMQFTVRSLALAGEGRLRMEVAELARSLSEASRRRRVYLASRRIGVTSPREGDPMVGRSIGATSRRLLVWRQVGRGLGCDSRGLRWRADQADVILLVRGGGLRGPDAVQLRRVARPSSRPGRVGIGLNPTSIADVVADQGVDTNGGRGGGPFTDELHVLAANSLLWRLSTASGRVASLRRLPRPVFTDSAIVLGRRGRLDSCVARRGAPVASADSASTRFAEVAILVTFAERASVGLGAARLEGLSPLAVLARGISDV